MTDSGVNRNNVDKVMMCEECEGLYFVCKESLYFVQSVCASPADYTGFDRLLGLCLCKVEDIEEVCSLECRRKSKYRLTFVCAASPAIPYLNFRDSNNNTLVRIGFENIFPTKKNLNPYRNMLFSSLKCNV